jgi:hypothetical protein
MALLESCPGFSRPGFDSMTTTRALGDMRDAENRDLVFQNLHIPPQKMLLLKQVHGDTVIKVDSAEAAQSLCGARPEGDGWLLSVRGYGAIIYTADCVPLFIRDASLGVIGIAHAGWRGVVKGLPGKLAEMVISHPAAKPPFCAFIGPHIKECCFEIRQDCADQLGPDGVILTGNGLRGDMSALIKKQLAAAGFAPEHVMESGHCTCCRKDLFFSYRRDRTSSGIMSFVFKP